MSVRCRARRGQRVSQSRRHEMLALARTFDHGGHHVQRILHVRHGARDGQPRPGRLARLDGALVPLPSRQTAR